MPRRLRQYCGGADGVLYGDAESRPENAAGCAVPRCSFRRIARAELGLGGVARATEEPLGWQRFNPFFCDFRAAARALPRWRLAPREGVDERTSAVCSALRSAIAGDPAAYVEFGDSVSPSIRCARIEASTAACRARP